MLWLLMVLLVPPSHAADPDRQAARLDKAAWKRVHDDPASCVALASDAMTVEGASHAARERLSETRLLCEAAGAATAEAVSGIAQPPRDRFEVLRDFVERRTRDGDFELADTAYQRLAQEARRKHRAEVHLQGIHLALLREDGQALAARMLSLLESRPSVDQRIRALDSMYALRVSRGEHDQALAVAEEQLVLAAESTRPADETLARSISVLQSAFESSDTARVDSIEASIRAQLEPRTDSWLDAMAYRALGELASSRQDHPAAVADLRMALSLDLPLIWRREALASLARNLEAQGQLVEARSASMAGWRLDAEARSALDAPTLRAFDRAHHNKARRRAFEDHVRLWDGLERAPRAWSAVLEWGEPGGPTPREICSALGSQEVLLDVVKLADRYVIFVVDRFCQPSRVDVPDVASVDELWRPLLNAICWRRPLLVAGTKGFRGHGLGLLPHPDGGQLSDHHDIVLVDVAGDVVRRGAGP